MRILSLLPGATETVGALGLVDSLVGRSHECDLPPEVGRLPVVTEPKLDVRAPSNDIDVRIKELIRESVSVYRVHAQCVRDLRPDVILTQTQCDVCAVTPQDLVCALAEWFGTAPRLVSVAPATLADVLGDLERIGEGCGAGAAGRALRAERCARLEEITAAAAGRQPRPKVACLEWIDPVMGSGSWIPELVDRAGGEPVLACSGSGAAWASVPAIAAADPDVLVLAPCGFDLARTRGEVGGWSRTEGWSNLRAVAEGRVFLVDGNRHMNRPGPRIAESLEILAEILQPDRLHFGHRGTAWEPLART